MIVKNLTKYDNLFKILNQVLEQRTEANSQAQAATQQKKSRAARVGRSAGVYQRSGRQAGSVDRENGLGHDGGAQGPTKREGSLNHPDNARDVRPDPDSCCPQGRIGGGGGAVPIGSGRSKRAGASNGKPERRRSQSRASEPYLCEPRVQQGRGWVGLVTHSDDLRGDGSSWKNEGSGL
ncbi:unnamed protein product [Linum trigynum]|uniref:Uncharacterized protein n=1 Tax=Linum trigynum TaxID=586398 RepID=A0AAV2ER44_9ROSI